MRVVLVNWAKIQAGASQGGGVNGYCQAVGLGLVARGHEVISVSSGTSYEARDGRIGACEVRRTDDWKGIQTHEVVNSPVLAPSMAQFKDPVGEVAAPALEANMARLFDRIRPDVVHFNSLEGFSAGCIDAALASGARVVFSLHNYHTICPQVYLMQGHRRPCFNSDNGHACASCIPMVETDAEKLKRAARGETLAVPQRPIPLPPPPWESIDRPAWQPLQNIIQPEPASNRPENAYSLRRAAMIAALNRCHCVLAVSDFVRRKFESQGVDPRVIRTQYIGCRLADDIASAGKDIPSSHPSGTPKTHRPIRLAFVGYNNWFKGLPMLADSLELLTPEVLAQFHLTVLALNGEAMAPQLKRLEGRLAGLSLGFGYEYHRLPQLLQGVDLGLVVSVWWDNAPQTVMEFLACGIPVLGAELGGIPEFVRDEQNGLLFRGNDRWALAGRLAGIAHDRAVLARLRAGVRPPKGMESHIGELEQVYRNRLS